MDPQKPTKVKFQESVVPERRGTEFLLEPPEQRIESESPEVIVVGKPPIPTQTQRIGRARTKKFLSPNPHSRKQNSSFDSNSAGKSLPPTQLNKYFSTAHQLQLNVKARNPAEKRGLKSSLSTDMKDKISWKPTKSTDKKYPHFNSWIEPNAPVPKDKPRTLRLPSFGCHTPTKSIIVKEKMISNKPLTEPERPKTPGTAGRRQDEAAEEEAKKLLALKGLVNDQKKDIDGPTKPIITPESPDAYLDQLQNTVLLANCALTPPVTPVKYKYPQKFKTNEDSSNKANAGIADTDIDQNFCLADFSKNIHTNRPDGVSNVSDDTTWDSEVTGLNQNSDGPNSDSTELLQITEKPPTATAEAGPRPKSVHVSGKSEMDRHFHQTRDRTESKFGQESYNIGLFEPSFVKIKSSDAMIVTDKATLKVNNLPDYMEYDEVMALFPKAISVTYPMYDRSGPATLKPTRYCYILFDEVSEAAFTFKRMDGHIVKGMELDLEYRNYSS